MNKFSHSLIQSFELAVQHYPIRANTHQHTNTPTHTHTTTTHDHNHTHTHHQHTHTTTHTTDDIMPFKIARSSSSIHRGNTLKNTAVREGPKVNNTLESPHLVTDSRRPITRNEKKQETRRQNQRETQTKATTNTAEAAKQGRSLAPARLYPSTTGFALLLISGAQDQE